MMEEEKTVSEISKEEPSETISEDEFVCGRDKVTDADGNQYKTAYFDVDGGHDVTKEGQCWMAENLNVGKVILNPGDEPSDNGVIEKWCMTDDWSAEFIPECDMGGGGGPRADICQERDMRRQSGEVLSESQNCTLRKEGGLYSWDEAMNYNANEVDGICPTGWVLPDIISWNKLKESIKRRLEELDIITSFHTDNRKKAFGLMNMNNTEAIVDEYQSLITSERLPVADELKWGDFNGNTYGVFNNGSFEDRWASSWYYTRESNLILLENYSGGNIGLELEIQILSPIQSVGAFLRCIKREE